MSIKDELEMGLAAVEAGWFQVNEVGQWIYYDNPEHNVCHCIVTPDYSEELYDEVLVALAREVPQEARRDNEDPYSVLTTWNDDPSRVKADVVNLFKRAIASCDEQD